MKKHSHTRQKRSRMTLDVLARMVKRGFDETASKRDVASLRTELKGDVASLRTELKDDIEILRRETQTGFREVRAEIAELRETVRELSVSVDKLVGVIEALRQEYFAIKVQLDRHERWIQELAKKAGVAFKA